MSLRVCCLAGQAIQCMAGWEKNTSQQHKVPSNISHSLYSLVKVSTQTALTWPEGLLNGDERACVERTTHLSHSGTNSVRHGLRNLTTSCETEAAHRYFSPHVIAQVQTSSLLIITSVLSDCGKRSVSNGENWKVIMQTASPPGAVNELKNMIP